MHRAAQLLLLIVHVGTDHRGLDRAGAGDRLRLARLITLGPRGCRGLFRIRLHLPVIRRRWRWRRAIIAVTGTAATGGEHQTYGGHQNLFHSSLPEPTQSEL